MLILILTLILSLVQNPTHELTINISSPHEGGSMMVGVFDNEEDFLERPVINKSALFKSGTITVKLLLPPGEYGISVYQDLNGDNQLNTNFLGIPNEPYGFGNNARGTMGPAHFEDCTVLMDGPKKMDIEVR